MVHEERHRLRAGKLPNALLSDLLERLPRKHKNLLIGPAVGVDAAAIEVSPGVLLAKSDPITIAGREQGRLAVHVNANDIACMGGRPKWLLVTILLPDSGEQQIEMLDEIVDELAKTCREISVTVVGGHTEITPAVNQPVVIGAMLGEVRADTLLDIRKCQPGDRLILVSGIAIEATSIIAHQCEKQLGEIFDKDLIARCQNFSKSPGVSVLSAALLAADSGLVRAMHDPTEGGIFTALHELCDASQCGIDVQAEHIFALPESRLLCDYFELNIFGVISSGALLAVSPADDAEELLAILSKHDMPAADIGALTEHTEHRIVRTGNVDEPMPRFDQDEITRIFAL